MHNLPDAVLTLPQWQRSPALQPRHLLEMPPLLEANPQHSRWLQIELTQTLQSGVQQLEVTVETVF